MVALVSRVRAAAIGFCAPHLVARGAAGIRADALERSIADLRDDVERDRQQAADQMRLVAAGAFDASWQSVLHMNQGSARSGATYEAAQEDAAVAIVAAKEVFLAELDRARDGVCLGQMVGGHA